MPVGKHSAGGGGDGTSGPGVGERAPAGKRAPRGSRGQKSQSKPFDPASAPEGGPSLAKEEERQFHATHFTADPRGSGASGAPPGGPRRKVRGGSPPKGARDPEKAAKPKRRGGAGSA